MTEIVFPKYGSIENLYKRNEILNLEPLICLEKVHGCNSRAMYSKEHGLVVGGRNHTLYSNGERRKQDGYGMVTWFLTEDRWEGMKSFPDHVFYGEFAGPGIQKGIVYGTEKEFIVFDIRGPDLSFLDWDEVVAISKEAQFKTMPVVLRGKITVEMLDEIVDQTSVIAKENGIDDPENTWEGVVIKPVTMQRNFRGDWYRAKYKSNKWAERAKGAVKTKRADPEMANRQQAAIAHAEDTVTIGRIHTIIDHITRDGNVELNMERTADFVRALVKDVMLECNDVYDTLEPNELKAHNKAVSSLGVRKWKEYLAENVL